MGTTITLCQSQPIGFTPSIFQSISIQSQNNPTSYQSTPLTNINDPPISQCISDLIAIKKPFLKQLNSIHKPTRISYKNGIYIGNVSKFRTPNGWGKYFSPDNSVVIGQFVNGQIQGKFFIAYPNTTYFIGQVHNNKITCQNGQYYTPQFQYIGGFLDSLYHGLGKALRGKYVIEGEWIQGRIVNGRLQWVEDKSTQKYIYQGEFNQKIQMHGRGILIEPYGQYTGQFINNKKHGKGQYLYNNLNKFIGYYSKGIKEGNGVLLSRYNQVLYEGQWQRDMPVRQQKLRVSILVNAKSNKLIRMDVSKRVESMRKVRNQVSTENQYQA